MRRDRTGVGASYEGQNRTLTTIAPDGSSTTSYQYHCNTVTVTDPAGKWKQHTMDAFGQLVQVVEPSPDANPNHVTTYAYDVLGHLIQAQMPRTVAGNVVTQTRTWNYDAGTQRLTSATQPETGTVSFTYNADGTLAAKTDAKSNQTQYTYDSYGELTQVARGSWNAGTSTFTEDVSQRVTYTYGGTNPLGPGQQNYSQNTAGRVSQIAYSGPHSLSFTEWYSYTAPGGVSAKRLTLTSGNSSHLDASYSYDSEGRMTSVQYPQQAGGNPIATYTYGFDVMGRLNTMTDQSNNVLVSGVTYNAANKLLTMAGTVVAESRTYNINQQLTELVSGSYHFRYNYSATQNNGRIQSMTDVASGKTVT